MTSTRRGSAAAALFLTAALAGCRIEDPQAIPGYQPEPFQESVMGANARVGSILLRSVHVEAPADVRYQAGDDAKLWFTVVNDGREPDVLTAVSSTEARATEIRWDSDCDGVAQAVASLPLQPTSPVPNESPAGVLPFDAYFARLLDLDRQVLAGTTIPVTFVLERAGSLTVDALVQPSNAPRAEPSARCHSSSAAPAAYPSA